MKIPKKLDIYQFNRFQDFVSSYYEQTKKASMGSFTLNRWAVSMGYQSPRVIAMAMKGQRAPSEELQEKIADHLGLKGNKKKYFDLLRKKAVLEQKGNDLSAINQSITKLNPRNLNLAPVDPNEFNFISEWYHLVIKQMTRLKGFRKDISLISKKLKGKVTPAKIEKSVDLLLRLGHLKESNNGMLEQRAPIKTGNTIPSIAIKRHHEGMLERAKESLYEDHMDHRHFSSVTMAFDRNDMPEAKKMIEEFLNEFDARFLSSREKAKDIYQINFQLFPHTKEERGDHE